MSGREQAAGHLSEGFFLLRKYDLYGADGKDHTAVADRVLVNLADDPDAPGIAAAFQALYEAKRLVSFKSAVDPKRIILGDYFTGLAVKLVLPLRSPRLMDEICRQLDEIGKKANNPLYVMRDSEFNKQTDGLCRGYLEGKQRQ